MYRNRNGLLLVVSGPSGVGKGTVCKALLERLETMRISISATTRPRRVNEIDGVNYFFKTQEEFEAMIEHGEFLEYMQVFGLNYSARLKRTLKRSEGTATIYCSR